MTPPSFSAASSLRVAARYYQAAVVASQPRVKLAGPREQALNTLAEVARKARLLGEKMRAQPQVPASGLVDDLAEIVDLAERGVRRGR